MQHCCKSRYNSFAFNYIIYLMIQWDFQRSTVVSQDTAVLHSTSFHDSGDC